MIQYFFAIVAGCLGLYLGGDFLIKGASAIGRRLGWSTAAIGFILISLGTSAPELFVSAGAALQGYGDMAAGNVVGSNIVNICIVLGLGALILPLVINDAIRFHQLPLMLVLTLCGSAFLADGHLGRLESLVLLLGACGSVWWVMRKDGLPEDAEDLLRQDDSDAAQMSLLKSLGLVLAGIGLLLFGAEGLIWGGVGLADAFGVPDAVIALTVTSIGTGLPEITATVLAVVRRDTDMAVGNVVGSNLMNIGLVLGVSGLLTPVDSAGVGLLPLGLMVVLSILLALLAWRPGFVSRMAGGGMLVVFGVYTIMLIQS